MSDVDNVPLIVLFGPPKGYNNLNDPIPWSNRPAVLKGLVITFLVGITL